MLNIEHLTKTYGGKAAVQDLSLHIRPGEICAFIGHNGAGKTGRLVRAGSMDEVRGDDSLEEVFLELEGTEAQA